MLDNLLKNACRYGRENGKIKVTLRVKSNEIELKVADDGIGIGERDLPHIWERFYRGGNSRGKRAWGWVFHWYSRSSGISREGLQFQAPSGRERNSASYLRKCGRRNNSLLFLRYHILFTE